MRNAYYCLRIVSGTAMKEKVLSRGSKTVLFEKALAAKLVEFIDGTEHCVSVI